MTATTVIGLIGRIGAGKSTVAARFATHGAEVIDADRIAHEVLKENDVVQQIAGHFGSEVLDADGQIRRRAVADRVFGPTPDHHRALEWLESVVRPRVRQQIATTLAAFLSRAGQGEARAGQGEARAGQGGKAGAVLVLDVPLLVQAGWADACDRLVLVNCPDEIRSQRLATRHWTAAEQEARETAWSRKYEATLLPPGKIATVDTSGDLAYTWAQVDLIWSGLSN
ncbi:MAG: dephospho-CoA kinase [Planctomycetota bacterium]